MCQKYPCRICDLEVKNDNPSVQCHLCDKWVQTTCADIINEKYEKLKQSLLPWYCPSYTKKIHFAKLITRNSTSFIQLKPHRLSLRKNKKSDQKTKEILRNFEELN